MPPVDASMNCDSIGIGTESVSDGCEGGSGGFTTLSLPPSPLSPHPGRESIAAVKATFIV